MSTNHYKNIESYLSGNLNPDEKIEFEKELLSDEALREEFNFQKNVIDGIKAYRKAELKSHLSSITVSPWELFIQSTVGKAVVGATSVLIISGSVYFFSQSPDQTITASNSSEITIDAPIASREFIFEIPEAEETNTTTQKDEPSYSSNKKLKPVPESSEIAENQNNSESQTSNDQIGFTPSIIVPEDVSEIEDEQQLQVSEISKDVFEKKVAENKEKPVDIEVLDTRSNILSYKYFDGKLSLLGDFGESPYQIIEVIGSGGKELYLFHDGNYYEIEVSSERKPLKAITDSKKIKELNILKNYK
jgi:hypothetical protein